MTGGNGGSVFTRTRIADTWPECLSLARSLLSLGTEALADTRGPFPQTISDKQVTPFLPTAGQPPPGQPPPRELFSRGAPLPASARAPTSPAEPCVVTAPCRCPARVRPICRSRLALPDVFTSCACVKLRHNLIIKCGNPVGFLFLFFWSAQFCKVPFFFFFNA